jgi:arsenite methyltransferase
MNTEIILESFENEEFVSLFDELPFWSAPFGISLLELIEPAQYRKVLDIGCGTGFPLLEIAQRFGSTSSVYGIDPWKTALKRLKKKIEYNKIENVYLLDAVAENLPFEDSSFDCVVSNNGLNNVNDFELSINEIHRVLKINSELVFSYNLPDTFLVFYEALKHVLNLYGKLDDIIKVDNHIFDKRKPKDYTIKKLKDNGFEIVTTKENAFDYKFADAESFFDYNFIKSAFLNSWHELIPRHERSRIFEQTKTELNRQAKSNGYLSFKVPFICIKAKKIV